MKKFQFKNKANIDKKTLYQYLIQVLLFLYVFFIPTFGENEGIFRYILYLNAIILTFLSIIFTFLYEKPKIYKETLLIPLFVVIGLVGTVYFSHEFRSWLSLCFLCISFYSLFLSFCIINDEKKVISIISLAIGCFCFVFIFYFRDKFTNLSSLASGSFRLGPPFDNANGVSSYAVICVATSLYLILFGRNKFKFLFIVPFLASVLVGISTGSRSFILFSFCFILILFLVKLRKKKILCLVSIATIIAFFILFLSLPALSFLKDRLINSFKTILGISDKADTSTINRVNYISYGFYMGSKNLLFGYGTQGFSLITGVNTYSHSNFAEVVCNFGILGLIVFYLPLVLLLLKAITNEKVNKTFIIAFILYYLLASLTNVIYYKKMYYLMLAFLFYLAFGSSIEPKSAFSNKKKLNICFLADSMGSGGAERVISSLSNEMSKMGHSVTILLVSSKDENSYYSLNDGVKLVSLVKNFNDKTSSFKRVLLMRKFYRMNNFDVVYAFLKHICIYNWISSIGFNFKTIVSERNDPNQYSKIEQFLVKRAFYAADKCVFQTEMAMEWYGDQIAQKSEIIFNPVHLMTKLRNNVRTKTIISVGRLEEQKNFEFLIDVFQSFSKKFPDYKYKIFGEGQLKDKLQDKINKLKMNHLIKLEGNDEYWHEHQYNAACFVLTSKFEGMPNALEEAACLGIPCVASNCNIGGPFELSKVLKNISLVNGYCINDYVTAIEASINSKNENINTDALQIKKIAERWLKLYE